MKFLSVLLLLIIGFGSAGYAQPVVSPSHKYWIEFTDKGITLEEFLKTSQADSVRHSISKEAFERRRLSLHTNNLEPLTWEDIPLSQSYLASLKEFGVSPENISKWLNGISVIAKESVIDSIRPLPFVKRVRDLGPKSYRHVEPAPIAPPLEKPLTESDSCTYDSVIYHYGTSQSQLDRINVIPLHAMGADATGVRIGFCDTGFWWKDHEALRTRNVLDEYDFVNHDNVTADQDGDVPDSHGHGTSTFGTAAAYKPDVAIGVAYNASYYLAKTEDLSSETPREEDNFAAALEWMEAKGVDIVNLSLGYFFLDSPYTSYTFKDLDGRTTIAARAAVIAARKGVLLVVAGGNTGESATPFVTTPADADSIITVGALENNDSVAHFSAKGPTADGRIKPEVTAPGVDIWTTNSIGEYKLATGTSLAAPLVTGAAALIKQVHPEATAQQIRRVLMMTASDPTTPDTANGWGRIDAYRAALELGPIIMPPKIHEENGEVEFCVAAASKDGFDSIVVIVSSAFAPDNQIRVTLRPEKDSNLYHGKLKIIPKDTLFYVVLGRKGIENSATYPLSKMATYVVQTGLAAVKKELVANESFTLSPNPASRFLVVRSDQKLNGRLGVCDALGRLIRSIKVEGASEVRLPLEDLNNGVYYIDYQPFTAKGIQVRQQFVVIK